MDHSIRTTAYVVLPCLDEARALPWVLARLPAGWRAIVVGNGSTDCSAKIAAGLGATVVREPRRGFGAACHAGLLAAEAEFVCFCDCDASLDPRLLPAFVAEVAAGRADLVLGRRRSRTRGAWPPHARAGNLALARMTRRRTGLRLHDLGPMRAARREALLELALTRPPQRLSAGDGRTGRRRRPADRRARCAVSAAYREVEGHGHLARHLAGGT